MTGRDIRAVRQRLGLSLTAMAEALGVDRQTVFRWEHGTPPPAYLWRALRDLEREG